VSGRTFLPFARDQACLCPKKYGLILRLKLVEPMLLLFSLQTRAKNKNRVVTRIVSFIILKRLEMLVKHNLLGKM
jgi:hypothetical protein